PNGCLSVINLSNFEYNGLIKIRTDKRLPEFLHAVKVKTYQDFTDNKLYDINQIPITEDWTNINEYLIDVKNLKPFSLTNITEKNINKERNIKITNNSVENSFIKLEVKTGKINITDKKTGEVYKDFIIISDRADIGDSYNFGALKSDKLLSAKLIKTYIKENNGLNAVLELIYEIEIPKNSTIKGRYKTKDKCKLNIDVILQNNSEFIEFNAKWKNKCKNHILQIGFNLKEKIYKTITEDMFGTIERRFNPDYDIYKDIPAERGKELKPNTAPMQRFVNAYNLTLFTKGLSEYEVNKNTLNLTLLRSTGIISNPYNPTRGTPAGPPIPTPKLQLSGNISANFAIAFTSDENKMFAIAENFYNPCITLFTDINDSQFIKNKNEKLLIYAVKKAEKGLLYRAYNCSDKTINFCGEKILPKTIKNLLI
ncbi:hypothetical protein II906_10635, partial [bacterium]|nr:hypothetical protein [bacterium]